MAKDEEQEPKEPKAPGELDKLDNFGIIESWLLAKVAKVAPNCTDTVTESDEA